MTKNFNKFKILALSVALVLHGVAGYGLSHMTMMAIEPPKVVPPLEIEMITLNMQEEAELPDVMSESVPTQTPPPPPQKSVASPAPPKNTPPKTEPKVESVKPPKSKPVPKQEPTNQDTPKPQEIKTPDVDIIAQQQQKAFEIQQQKQREQEKEQERQKEQERLRKEQERQREEAQRQREIDAENARRAQEAENARKKAQQEAENAKKHAEQGQGKGGDGRDTKTDNKDKGDKTAKTGNDKGGGELKGQNLSISNASWQRKPSWDGLTSEKLNGSASFTATLTIDASGRIVAVSGVSTGDKSLDRQIEQAIRRAKLKPFKSADGQPMSGTASFGTTVNF